MSVEFCRKVTHVRALNLFWLQFRSFQRRVHGLPHDLSEMLAFPVPVPGEITLRSPKDKDSRLIHCEPPAFRILRSNTLSHDDAYRLRHIVRRQLGIIDATNDGHRLGSVDRPRLAPSFQPDSHSTESSSRSPIGRGSIE